MEDLNWIDMLERMQSIRYFSRIMIKRATKEYQMPAEHLDLLSQLAVRKEKMTPMTLSKLMNVNKTIISRIIEQLNNKGYVIKTDDEIDKRRYFVSITELGEEELRKIYKHYLGPIYELRNRVGEDYFLKFMSYIEVVNSKMSTNEEEIEK